MNEKILLTPKQVSERLGISRSFTYKLIQQGRLPTIRFGRSVRVPANYLDEMVTEKLEAWKAAQEGGEK